MRNVVVALGALAALAGCNSEQPAAPAPSASASQPTASSPATSPSLPGAARAFKVKNELYSFEYAYPVEAGVIPQLRKLLDEDLDDQTKTLARDAIGEQESLKQDGLEYRPSSLSFDWKVVTDLPAWLSLSTIVGSYTGGAHPNYYYDTLLWDKRANRRRDPRDLFTSKEALRRVIRKDFCAALDRERIKRRGEQPEPGGMFWDCIDPVAETVMLGSSHGKAFNRIGVLVPPYEAGPYAEGSYEVTLPVTAAVLATVRPEFQSSFVAAR